MKFLFGFITGVVSTVLIIFVIGVVLTNDSSPNSRRGLTIFQEKGECLTSNELTVFQALEPTMALVEHGEYPNDSMALLINYNNQYYYDDQIIEIPDSGCARQIGIYRYETNAGSVKTVPVVEIE